MFSDFFPGSFDIHMYVNLENISVCVTNTNNHWVIKRKSIRESSQLYYEICHNYSRNYISWATFRDKLYTDEKDPITGLVLPDFMYQHGIFKYEWYDERNSRFLPDFVTRKRPLSMPLEPNQIRSNTNSCVVC